MAAHVDVSDVTALRIWRAHGLKPHRVESFKLSNDPQFADKLEAIVGLYLSPPEHALVLCSDEKSQIQALDRTQPGLPMKRGRGASMTHDYKRHGTATLFAALNAHDGTVIADCKARHRHEEWLAFLRQIDQENPKDKVLHLICDNYATHKHSRVKAWLKKHPRFHMHFTPTSGYGSTWSSSFSAASPSIVYAVGVFQSVAELTQAIEGDIAACNQNHKPFVWTAKANDILQKVMRGAACVQNGSNRVKHYNRRVCKAVGRTDFSPLSVRRDRAAE